MAYKPVATWSFDIDINLFEQFIVDYTWMCGQ